MVDNFHGLWRIAEAIEKSNKRPLTKEEKIERQRENKMFVRLRLSEYKREMKLK